MCRNINNKNNSWEMIKMSIFENSFNMIIPWLVEIIDDSYWLDKYDIKYIIKIVVLMFIIESQFCNSYVIVIASLIVYFTLFKILYYS